MQCIYGILDCVIDNGAEEMSEKNECECSYNPFRPMSLGVMGEYYCGTCKKRYYYKSLTKAQIEEALRLMGGSASKENNKPWYL